MCKLCYCPRLAMHLRVKKGACSTNPLANVATDGKFSVIILSLYKATAVTKITNRVFIWLQRADALTGPNSIKTAGSWQQRAQRFFFSPHYLSDSKVWSTDNNAPRSMCTRVRRECVLSSGSPSNSAASSPGECKVGKFNQHVNPTRVCTLGKRSFPGRSSGA